MNNRINLIKDYAKYLEPNKGIIPNRNHVKRAIIEMMTIYELNAIYSIYDVTLEDLTDYILQKF